MIYYTTGAGVNRKLTERRTILSRFRMVESATVSRDVRRPGACCVDINNFECGRSFIFIATHRTSVVLFVIFDTRTVFSDVFRFALRANQPRHIYDRDFVRRLDRLHVSAVGYDPRRWRTVGFRGRHTGGDVFTFCRKRATVIFGFLGFGDFVTVGRIFVNPFMSAIARAYTSASR